MIVSFLFLINYLLKVVQNRIPKSTLPCELDAIHLLNSLNFEGTASNEDNVGIRFFPPAFCQRYKAVLDVLVKLQSIYDIKKIVDLGCSEITFFTHVKTLENIEEYIGVDIDQAVLERSACRANPLNVDYLSRRCAPLSVKLLHGSAADPDVSLKHTNAVIAIELIEHLFPPELDNLPYNIFSVIQPDVAIFTTPNADFNVLFRSLGPNSFRHDDHKFEWSRQQFEDWGLNLTLRYPCYEVWFNGIGRGPDGTEEFGCCSQIAVFVRKEVKAESSEFNVYYNTVHEIQYPYETREEKYNNILEADVYQFIDSCSHKDEYLVGERFEIPLVTIISYITVPCTEDKLKTYLEKIGKNVEFKDNQLILVIPNLDDDNRSLSPFDEFIEEIYDHEESWIIENNGFINDLVNNDESWDCVLENENEMIPESNSNNDETDEVNNLEDDFAYLLGNSENYASQNEQVNPAMDVLCDPKHIVVKDFLFSDEDIRADSATPVGENQVEYLNVDSNLHNSGSTGSGNTSKSSDTLVESSLSPMNTARSCANDDKDENDILSPLKSSFSDKEQYPCSSSSDKSVGNSKNVPDSFHKNDDEFTYDVIQSVNQKEINDNKKKQDMDIKFASSVSSVKEPNDIVDTVVDEGSDSKEVSHDQAPSIVTRSQSLENVNMYKCKDKCFRYSLNIDNKLLGCDTSVVDMDLETCKGSSIPSLTETYGSHSKAVDSGYPNSTQDMELDLTPEQVDEIITETESSLEDEDSSAEERVEHVQGNPPLVFADNVENGDVANNNRDGEGNNMEGGEVLPEELIFEDLVIGGEEVEAADEHESDDDGLFLSALDVSNDTIVPEEMSSNEDTVYLFDLPSPSSYGSLLVEVSNVENQNQFPSWLLNMEVWDEGNGGGDAGPDRDGDSSDLVVDREGQVDFYPGDARAGGEPTMPEN